MLYSALQFVPHFPLVFVIGIAGDAYQFHNVRVRQGSVKVLAILANLFLRGVRFLDVQFPPLFGSDSFSVEFRRQNALTGSLV